VLGANSERLDSSSMAFKGCTQTLKIAKGSVSFKVLRHFAQVFDIKRSSVLLGR